MLSVELGNLADILDSAGKARNVSSLAKQWSKRVHDAVLNSTIVNDIYAYETNGQSVYCAYCTKK